MVLPIRSYYDLSASLDNLSSLFSSPPSLQSIATVAEYLPNYPIFRKTVSQLYSLSMSSHDISTRHCMSIVGVGG